VLGIGLDPYTVDFDTEFFRGKPLNAYQAARAEVVQGSSEEAASERATSRRVSSMSGRRVDGIYGKTYRRAREIRR
jgi:hypothetical protein